MISDSRLRYWATLYMPSPPISQLTGRNKATSLWQ